MLQQQREILEARNVAINASNSDVHFGVGRLNRMELEPYCELRNGKFEIGRIGSFSYLGGGASVVRNVDSIGRFCSIAPNLVAGPVEHPSDFISAHCLLQGSWGGKWDVLRDFYERNSDSIQISKEIYNERYSGENRKIIIGNDVWVGENAFLRRGVSIGDGAIIGARTVVTRDVAPYEIVVGVPSRHLRLRFDEATVKKLMELQWWNYGLSALEGVDFSDINTAIVKIEQNIKDGTAQLYCPDLITIMEDGCVV